MTQEKRMMIKLLSTSGLSLLVTLSTVAMDQQLVLRSDFNPQGKRKDVLVVAEDHKTKNITPLKNIVRKEQKNTDNENNIERSIVLDLSSNVKTNKPVAFKKLSGVTEEQNKKAKQEKKAKKQLAKALILKHVVDTELTEKEKYYSGFDDFQLEEEVAKKPSMRRHKSIISKKKITNEPLVFDEITNESFVFDNDIRFDRVLEISNPIVMENYNDSTVLRRDHMWTPSATRNLDDAIAGNMDNTTALKSMIRQNEKAKAKKTMPFNLENDLSSEDSF